MKRLLHMLRSSGIIPGLLAALSLGGAFYLMQTGLENLIEARQTERLPVTPVQALAEGPYALGGVISAERGTLTTPYSGTEAVYYRYRLEEEYRDSDGNRRTRTIDSGQDGRPFVLVDDTGSVVIHTGYDISGVDWDVRQTHRSRSGNRIRTEWALKPGGTVEVVGSYEPSEGHVVFNDMARFDLPALVSARGLHLAGGDRLFQAAMRISGAAGLLALGIALGMTALRIHRFWVYVLVMSVGVTGTLGVLGVNKLNSEWSSVLAMYEKRHSHLSTRSDDAPFLADLYAFRQLIERNTDGYLDQWMFRRLVEKQLSLPAVDDQVAGLAREVISSKPQTHFEHATLAWLGVIGGVLAGFVLIWRAIGNVKFKRLVEHVPTSRTRGLSFGLSELKGVVETCEENPPLRCPLKHADCVAYKYWVEERRGSGKNAKWVTVETENKQVPFWLEDDEGRVLVYPEGAEIEFPNYYNERHGDHRYNVRWFDTYARTYCLGFAGLDPNKPDRLAIQQDAESPFFMTSRTADEVIRSRGAQGFIGTAFSLGLFLFGATAMLAMDGNFSPDNLLFSALIVPVVLGIYISILHFNDIVFLKNRVGRARANIDTVLQQRHDLWPALETVVKAYLSHESKLLRAIGTLRSNPPSGNDPMGRIARRLRNEERVRKAIQIRAEKYPDLQGDAVIRKFMDTMAETENYLSLLRNGYTESVEIYNTRIQSVPDVILAYLFRFRPAEQFVRSS